MIKPSHDNERPLRYGIVGVGGWGTKRRASLRAAGGFEIVGGVDVRREAFDEAAREEGRSIAQYPSVGALCEDSSIEAVFICTPAQLHVEQAMTAARAGKAIFTEKPLGPDPVACRELVRYCEAHHIPHGHGFSMRFTPHWQHVKTILDSGQLGRIVSVSAATMSTAGLYFPPDNWRFRAGENPGGPLFQCGIHKIDLLRFLFGDGRWISGVKRSDFTNSPTEDSMILLGEFGGVTCTLHCHYVASYRHAIEIYGTDGDLFITDHPPRIEIKRTDLKSFHEPVIDITADVPRSDAETQALRDFAMAVRQRRQPIMNGRDGLRAVELVVEAASVAVEHRHLVDGSNPNHSQSGKTR